MGAPRRRLGEAGCRAEKEVCLSGVADSFDALSWCTDDYVVEAVLIHIAGTRYFGAELRGEVTRHGPTRRGG